MDIATHNIMNGLRKWIMESDWNTMRLHVSHNDMDGYGCHVMTRLAVNVLNPNSKSSITFWNTSAGMESIERTVRHYITRMETVPKDAKKRYAKGKKKLFILFSDLGGFDPNFINTLIEEGHKVNYLCVDHHQIANDLNKVELTGNTEEFQLAKNCYYVDDTTCATKSLGNAIRAIITQQRPASTLSSHDIENYQNMKEQVRAYAEKVDSFDRGLWGDWVGLEPTEVDGAVREQLFFKSFKPEERYRYVSLIANYLHTYAFGIYTPKDKRPFWCLDMNRFSQKYYAAVTSQLKVLNAEFEKCKKMLRPLTIPIDIPDTIQDKDKLNIHEIYTTEDDAIQSFTLVSRELLKMNPDIDIIVLIYMKRKTMDMRTMRDDLNLADIAIFNGGGGHPKAAGFPMKKTEAEKELDNLRKELDEKASVAKSEE